MHRRQPARPRIVLRRITHHAALEAEGYYGSYHEPPSSPENVLSVFDRLVSRRGGASLNEVLEETARVQGGMTAAQKEEHLETLLQVMYTMGPGKQDKLVPVTSRLDEFQRLALRRFPRVLPDWDDCMGPSGQAVWATIPWKFAHKRSHS